MNHECLPILMVLYIMHAYLMTFSALSNAVCLNNAFFPLFRHRFFKMLFVVMLSLGVLTHSLFTSCIILHHAQCFYSVEFHNFMFTPFFVLYMKGLCALW